MKEFPHKISASGWDIGQVKDNPTTGFSGTKDSCIMLPLDVQHMDLPEQKHTNALVLGHLLQADNSVVLLPSSAEGTGSDAERLLRTVVGLEPAIQVILDVGAQILELDNLGVAYKWLELQSQGDKQAVVFVNENDELCVVDRQGRIEFLHTSSYLDRLDTCLVFLDEAHTRGIDLKLPVDYRAAVTLGANLTKDRVTQASMRMRKLGKGQTLTFCVPEEISTKIHECTAKPVGEIDIADILRWAISNTFVDAQRGMPLWANQGQRFVHHRHLMDNVRSEGVTKMTLEHSQNFLEDEAQSLERRYAPRLDRDADVLSQHIARSDDPDSARIVERCEQFKDLNFHSSELQEEQERELSPEIEQECQVQKPSAAEPLKHVLHPDLVSFWNTGVLKRASKAFLPAFETLRDTSAAADYDVSQLRRQDGLLVTADFARTVLPSGKSYQSDSYQRPVQWILTSITANGQTVKDMVVISPFEANSLTGRTQRVRNVAMHVYKPRSNLAYEALDDLHFVVIPKRAVVPSIPSELIVQLNLFAGQLYFTSFQAYLDTCKFLGIAAENAPTGGDGAALDHDGDVEMVGAETDSRKSPVAFFASLMAKVRRDGDGIGKTHMGKVLEGRLLRKEDFEEDSREEYR